MESEKGDIVTVSRSS